MFKIVESDDERQNTAQSDIQVFPDVFLPADKRDS